MDPRSLVTAENVDAILAADHTTILEYIPDLATLRDIYERFSHTGFVIFELTYEVALCRIWIKTAQDNNNKYALMKAIQDSKEWDSFPKDSLSATRANNIDKLRAFERELIKSNCDIAPELDTNDFANISMLLQTNDKFFKIFIESGRCLQIFFYHMCGTYQKRFRDESKEIASKQKFEGLGFDEFYARQDYEQSFYAHKIAQDPTIDTVTNNLLYRLVTLDDMSRPDFLATPSIYADVVNQRRSVSDTPIASAAANVATVDGNDTVSLTVEDALSILDDEDKISSTVIPVNTAQAQTYKQLISEFLPQWGSADGVDVESPIISANAQLKTMHVIATLRSNMRLFSQARREIHHARSEIHHARSDVTQAHSSTEQSDSQGPNLLGILPADVLLIILKWSISTSKFVEITDFVLTKFDEMRPNYFDNDKTPRILCQKR